MAKPKIIREWETTEINPEEIARHLHGQLEESDDSESDWNIHLHYGRKNPVITIKLDLEFRAMHLLIHRPRRGQHLTTLTDIEKLEFHLYILRGKEHCELWIEGSGSNVNISSYGHINFFGTKKNREAAKQARRQHGAKLLPLKKYLENRDTYLLTEVYAEFVRTMNAAGVSDEEFKQRLEDAFSHGSIGWHEAGPEFHAERIEKTKV